MKCSTTIPDSSFFWCFLGDIKKPDSLLKILQSNEFRFVTAEIISTEIKKKPIEAQLLHKINKNVEIFSYHQYGEILKPLFSDKEIKKGEHEVIVISYILNFKREDFIAVLDDNAPKKFLKRLIPNPIGIITGTVGFIEICTVRSVFRRAEAITILILIKESKFRIDDAIVDSVISRIESVEK